RHQFSPIVGVSPTGRLTPAARRYRPLTSLLSFKKRKQLRQLILLRPAAVFADLERFGVLDLRGCVLAVPVGERGAKAVGEGAVAVGETLAHLAAAVLLFGRVARNQLRRAERAAFVEL